MKVKSLSRVQPSATPWTAAFQARVLECGAIAFSESRSYLSSFQKQGSQQTTFLLILSLSSQDRQDTRLVVVELSMELNHCYSNTVSLLQGVRALSLDGVLILGRLQP